MIKVTLFIIVLIALGQARQLKGSAHSDFLADQKHHHKIDHTLLQTQDKDDFALVQEDKEPMKPTQFFLPAIAAGIIIGEKVAPILYKGVVEGGRLVRRGVNALLAKLPWNRNDFEQKLANANGGKGIKMLSKGIFKNSKALKWAAYQASKVGDLMVVKKTAKMMKGMAKIAMKGAKYIGGKAKKMASSCWGWAKGIFNSVSKKIAKVKNIIVSKARKTGKRFRNGYRAFSKEPEAVQDKKDDQVGEKALEKEAEQAPQTPEEAPQTPPEGPEGPPPAIFAEDVRGDYHNMMYFNEEQYYGDDDSEDYYEDEEEDLYDDATSYDDSEDEFAERFFYESL